jgi:hypothetical protein
VAKSKGGFRSCRGWDFRLFANQKLLLSDKFEFSSVCNFLSRRKVIKIIGPSPRILFVRLVRDFISFFKTEIVYDCQPHSLQFSSNNKSWNKILYKRGHVTASRPLLFVDEVRLFRLFHGERLIFSISGNFRGP